MDPDIRLEYVLLNLTPTRTRCDLVIFAGKSNEKLAYGLLEPFIAHLRSAKDQVSKGGYSVTLRPSSSASSAWFTKATLQRFVRFVSTPEILERFVTIEREIGQLDNSIKSYEASNCDGRFGGENEGNGTAVGETSLEEENSKVRLQRVVETRKAVLCKEQAMVYARALAAGFETDNLDDLLFFSDAFGASRLREACLNFKELRKKKFEDRLWVDEIAAMQAMMQPDLPYLATSGITLAEDNEPTQNFMMSGRQSGNADLSDSVTSHGSSDANQDNGLTPTDARMQIPNPWGNQLPPYVRNFQGQVYQQMPPYQGYAYPGMHVASSYYPPTMQWPPNGDHESHDRRDHKKSRKKEKSSRSREHEEIDGSSETSGSSSETESESSSERSRRKKHGNKSSRKVVIRNINYITSKRDGEKNGASEMDSSDEKLLKSSTRKNRKRNGSKNHCDGNEEDASPKSKGDKGNENWDALQQLLLRDELDSNTTESQSVKVEEEYIIKSRSEEQETKEGSKQRADSADVVLVMDKNTCYNGSSNYDPVENSAPGLIRRDAIQEEFLFSQWTEDSEGYKRVSLSGDTAPVMKSQTSDDWFISKNSNQEANDVVNDQMTLIHGDYAISSAEQVEKKRKDVIIDDSLMIQGRLTNDHTESQLRTNIGLSDIMETSLVENGASDVQQKKSESVGFYEPDDIYMGLDRDVVEEQAVPAWTPEMDFENSASYNPPTKSHSNADANSDSNLMSNGKGPRNKKSGASVTKAPGKDARSRTLGGPLRKGKSEATPATKRSTFGSKTTTPKNQLAKEDERRKRMEELALQRQKRIAERSATGDGKSSVSSRKPQSVSKTTVTSLRSSAEAVKKQKPILKSSTIERLAAAKTTPKTPSPVTKKVASKVNGRSQKNTTKTKTSEKKAGDETIKRANSSISHCNEEKGNTDKCEQVDDTKDIKELHIASVINKNVLKEKEENPSEDHFLKLNSVENNNNEILKESITPLEAAPAMSIHLPLDSHNKTSASILIIEEKSSINEKTHGSPEIHETEESAHQTAVSALDPIQSRKKWDHAENFPKGPKRLRKFLMFGRKG